MRCCSLTRISSSLWDADPHRLPRVYLDPMRGGRSASPVAQNISTCAARINLAKVQLEFTCQKQFCQAKITASTRYGATVRRPTFRVGRSRRSLRKVSQVNCTGRDFAKSRRLGPLSRDATTKEPYVAWDCHRRPRGTGAGYPKNPQIGPFTQPH